MEVGGGIVLDVNSLYPSVMYYDKMPYGEGKYFFGQYVKDDMYDLYIQNFSCTFELKEKHIPTLQIKGAPYAFKENEYLTSSNSEEVFLSMTNIDLSLFLDHYNVYNLNFIDGWKFKSKTGFFKGYIDKWSQTKIESKENGNSAMYTLAKLMLNALYGKFALNPEVRSKIPFFDEEQDRVRYKFGEKEQRKPVYLPIGTFITSYARNKTIRSAQKVYDRFIYADTDSLHLIGTEIPDCLEIDKTKLGAWDHELTFIRGRYICQKRYLETYEVGYKELKKALTELDLKEIDEQFRAYWFNGTLVRDKITCAGMPKSCYKQVTWDNFKIGEHFDNKLIMRHVKGGIVLKDLGFTMKG